jgi:hypothetical protein
VALRKLTLLRSPWLRASGNGGMKHRRHGASMCGSKHILKRASGLQRKAGAGARASVRSQSLGTHPCILLPWKRGSLSNSVSEDVQAPSKDGKLSNKTRTGRPRGPRATRCNAEKYPRKSDWKLRPTVHGVVNLFRGSIPVDVRG